MTVENVKKFADLEGTSFPDVSLPATDGSTVNLATLSGLSVLLAFPRTSPADGSSIPGWDKIPGAKGCTAQTCGFRDNFQALRDAGATRIVGLSTQDTSYQQEAAKRLGLPFALLSDAELELQTALSLPTFDAGGMRLLHRFVMLVDNGHIEKVFHSLDDTSRYSQVTLDHLRFR